MTTFQSSTGKYSENSNRYRDSSADENEGMTEVDEDEDEDNMDDSSGWNTVEELTWRSRWWEASNNALDSAIRIRVTARRRKRSSGVAVAELSSLCHPSQRPPMPQRADDVIPIVSLPPNTFQIYLAPNREYGLGLRLGVTGTGYVVVRGFVRNRMSSDVNEDARGAAERCGLIEIGDILVNVNGIELPTLGMEDILIVLQGLESARMEPVSLRFVFGPVTTINPVPASETDSPLASSPSEMNPLLDMFNFGAFEKNGRKKISSKLKEAAKSSFPLGLDHPLSVAAAWLDGELEEDDLKRQRPADERLYTGAHVADAILLALKRRSLYPCMYPTPCMQQRGDMLITRLLPELAEEARPWVVAQNTAYTCKLNCHRKRLKRDGDACSSRVRRNPVQVKMDLKEYKKCITALEQRVEEQRQRRKQSRERVILQRSSCQSVKSVDSILPDLEDMEPVMTVTWSCGEGASEDSARDIVPDVDKKLFYLQSELNDADTESDCASTISHSNSMTRTFGTVLSSSKELSMAQKHMPVCSTTLTLHKILLSPQISLLLEESVYPILSDWIESFQPMPMNRREVLRPRVITGPLALSLGFPSAQVMNEHLTATEDLVTLYLLLHTCVAWLRARSAAESEDEGKSPRGICERGLHALGLSMSALRAVSVSVGVVEPERNQWSDEDTLKFLRRFGAYIHLDTAAAACNVMNFDLSSSVVQSLASMDVVYSSTSSEVGYFLLSAPPHMNCHVLMSRIVRDYGYEFNQYLCLFLHHLWTFFCRHVEAGIETSIYLFPFIRPWNIKRALLSRLDHQSQSMHCSKKSLDEDLVYLQYLDGLFSRYYECRFDSDLVADAIETVINVRTKNINQNSSFYLFQKIIDIDLQFNIDTIRSIGLCKERRHWDYVICLCKRYISILFEGKFVEFGRIKSTTTNIYISDSKTSHLSLSARKRDTEYVIDTLKEVFTNQLRLMSEKKDESIIYGQYFNTATNTIRLLLILCVLHFSSSNEETNACERVVLEKLGGMIDESLQTVNLNCIDIVVHVLCCGIGKDRFRMIARFVPCLLSY